MSTDAESNTRVAYTEEELINLKQELACLLKERISVNETLADAWRPLIMDDIEKYLTIKRSQRKQLDRCFVLYKRIEELTKIFVD